jgi:hypothetical protein
MPCMSSTSTTEAISTTTRMANGVRSGTCCGYGSPPQAAEPDIASRSYDVHHAVRVQRLSTNAWRSGRTSHGHAARHMEDLPRFAYTLAP